MNIKQAYNIWADQYDTNENKTRDLEASALRTILSSIPFNNCLEIGCGTGKNTSWLNTRSEQIVAVDFSIEMLAKAREKICSDTVEFVQADITNKWTFGKNSFDLIVFSLVLEHIENLDTIFEEAANALKKGGYIYIGELHPFKQYAGSKARFESENGTQILDCFTHHISDFTNTAKKFSFETIQINEYFDNQDRSNLPRILTMLLKKGSLTNPMFETKP